MNTTSSQSGRLIDGKALAQRLRKQVAQDVSELKARGQKVALDAVLVEPADDDQSRAGAVIYAENQRSSCARLGIEYRLHRLPAGSRYEDIAGRVLLLNAEEHVTAIMLHLPVPDGVDAFRIQSLIHPTKDVEGVNPANIGNVVYGRSSLVPCTALAVMRLVESTGLDLRGARVVCVGASDIVGKPIAVLMMRQEATVVSCNKFTENLAEETTKADVLIVAVGKQNLISADMVKPGAVVIDVGINRITDAQSGRKSVVGDVDFEAVRSVAGWITPVPGGVGPMTVAMLMRNTVDAAAT